MVKQPLLTELREFVVRHRPHSELHAKASAIGSGLPAVRVRAVGVADCCVVIAALEGPSHGRLSTNLRANTATRATWLWTGGTSRLIAVACDEIFLAGSQP